MKNTLLLSCFLFLFNMGCVGPTGFLIDESQKSTLKDINKLFLVIQVKSHYVFKAKRAGCKKLDRYYVSRYAGGILKRSSGLEVEYTDNKNTDKSFVFIKITSMPFCNTYKPGGYKCPGGRVFGNISLYLKGEKIFIKRFRGYVQMQKQYYGYLPNSGEIDALRRSKDFKNILNEIGSEIRLHSTK